MKIIKKIALIIIGILLSLIILEACLQIAGFTLTAIKKYKNKITKDPNTITILCLGESTTDGQWPPILQKILDKKSPDKKFNVIDEGIIGTNTKKIAGKLEGNLIKYNPDIIISMSGTNDTGLIYNQYKFKILNLIQLIVFHIATHCFYTDASFFEIDSECNELIKNSNFLLAQKKYYNLLKKSKFSDETVYERLWSVSLRFNIDFCDELLKHNESFITIPALEYIMNYLINYKNYDKEQIRYFLIENKDRILCVSKENYNKIIEILKNNDCSFLINDIKQNRQQNKKYLIRNLVDYKNKSNIKIKNYIYIINKAKTFNNKILFIVMQYPTLPVEQLKKDLKDSPYYDKLIFVSNEENFKQALQKYKTEEIFTDMFGGSFGHCTKLGNTLIAENVAETILKLYN